MEEPDRVAAAANAGDKQVGETLLALEDLAARLDADDAVEIAHHHRIRVRPEGTAEDVVGRANVRDPVAQGLVDRFLEGLLPGLDPAHFGPEETHADDVEALALHVCRAHVNDTLHPEARRHCRRRDPVLASPGLGDDALFAEALREDDLTEGIVDLVGAGVEKILALQVNAGPAEFLGPTFREVERRLATTEFGKESRELGLEVRILLCLEILRRERVERRHEGLGDKTPAKGAEMAARVGEGLGKGGRAHRKKVTLKESGLFS